MAEQPLLRIVRGAPDEVELAALTVVLAAATSAGSADPPAPSQPSGWASRAAMLRRPLQPGPGAWRAAARTY